MALQVSKTTKSYAIKFVMSAFPCTPFWRSSEKHVHGLVKRSGNLFSQHRATTKALAALEDVPRLNAPIRSACSLVAQCGNLKAVAMCSEGGGGGERPLLGRQHLHQEGRRLAPAKLASLGGLCRHFHLQPVKMIMADTVRIREATMYDKDSVLMIESDHEKELDPLLSQYEEHLLAPYRHCYVAENQYREVLGFFCASLVDSGTTLTFTPSRQVDPDLVPIFHDHLINDLSHKSPNLRNSLGVFHIQDGRQEADVMKTMRNSGKEILKRQQCRLELHPEDVKDQMKCHDGSSVHTRMIVPSKLWEILDNSNMGLLFPEEKAIVCGEAYTVNKSNLDMLWGTKIRNVRVTDSGGASTGAEAVSIRNNYTLKNAMVHFVDIYANNDLDIFRHFVSQLNDSLRHTGSYNVTHVYNVCMSVDGDVELFLGTCQENLKTRISKEPGESLSLVAFDL